MTSRPPSYGPPVNRWRRPSTKLLSGDRQACGKPPFDPFLTASLICTTHLCPVTAVHDLLHGTSMRPRPPGGPAYSPAGDQWHEYIARLRLRIASGDLALPTDAGHALEVVRHDFEEWVHDRHLPDPDAQRFWEDLVAPYVRTRLSSGALQSLVGHSILPEVTIGSWLVEVPHGGGQRTYPIEARVDEIDLTSGVLIERTTMPIEQAVLYKDVQLVVGSLILQSLPAAGIPEEWAALRSIDRFVLEAPNGSVDVTPGSEHFDAVHEAAAIIQDLAASETAEAQIREHAQCTPVNPHEVCSHPYRRCFYRVPTFPQARTPIRRETRRLCRAELYELLWQRDVAKYRLYDQASAGDRFPASEVEFIETGRDNHGRDFVDAVLRNGRTPSYHQCDLIVGTPFVGVRRSQVQFIEDSARGALRLYCDIGNLPLPNTGVLWPAVGEGFLMDGSFDFLIRQVQRDLFSHLVIGRNDPQTAQGESALQLLDAIFGGHPPLETS